jgi:hypothetical protein
MHVSLDSALGRQRRLNQIGESITQIAPDPAAAYSLRSLTGSDPKVVRVRRGSDNDERDFTASEVSSGALTSYVNAQVVAPLDIKALTATGRDGAYQIAKAAYSLRSLGTRQATVAATGDTVTRANGKYVCQVRRNVNGDLKSFTADEVSDGTLTSFVNESFTSSLPLDVAGSSAAAAYGLRDLTTGGTSVTSSGDTGGDTTGKFVVQVRRASDNTIKSFTAAEIADGTLLAFVNDSSVATVNTQDFTDGSSWSETGGGSARFTTNSVTGGTGARQVISTYQFKAGTTYKITLDGNPNALNTAQCGVHLNRVSDNALTALVSNRTFAFNLDTTFTPSDDSFLRIRTFTGTVDWTYSNFTVQVVTSDGHVSTWYDQSGNSNNATQATPASQPKIVSAGALVTDGIDFDGTDDRLDIDFGSNLSQPNSIFMAHQSGTTLGAKNDFFDEVGTAGQRTLIDQTGSNYRIFAGSSATSSLSSDTNKNLITAIYNGASSILAKNGTAESALNPSTQSIASTSAIGFSRTTPDYYQGTMQEFIIYNSDQTDKRRAIEESIATANGITLGSFSRDGFVKTWYDQSVSDQSDAGSTPTGNHATQADTTKQPRVVINGSLNADGIKFDGTDDFFDAVVDGFGSSSACSVFTAQYQATKSILGDTNNRRLIFGLTDTQFYLSNLAINETYTGVTSGETSLFSAIHNGTSSVPNVSIHANGNAGTTSHHRQGSLMVNNPISYIGKNTTSGANFYNQFVQEIIIYDTDQTANRTAIEANIGEAYSIDLPSGVDPGFDQVDGFVETWYDQSGHSSNLTNAWSLGNSNTAFLSNTSSANQITATANSSAGTTGARLIYSFDNFVAPAGSTITATFNVTSITGSVIIKHTISASPSTSAGGDAFEINSTGTFTYSFTTTVDAYGLVAIFGADEAIDAQLTSLTANINVTQATSSLQPKIVNAGALLTDSSGNPALVGDGTSLNGLFNSTLTEQLDNSDFLVTAAYKDELAMGITGAVPRLYLTSGGMSYNTNQTISYSNQTGRNILSFQVVGNTQEVFANGSSIGTASQAQANIGQSLFGVMQGGSSISSGPLMEVLVYDSNQSAKRATIEANINGHYSIF